MELSGSCYCSQVKFTLESKTPYPYQRCYCSICRKTNGGGGFAINIMGVYDSLEVEGEDYIDTFRVPAERTITGGEGLSESRRRFCSNCGSYLWVYNPNHADNVYPFASSIETDLPDPPERFHIMLGSKANWVDVPEGPDEKHFETYSELSIQEWHEKHDIILD